MTFRTRIGALAAPGLAIALACVAMDTRTAHADIVGFGDYTTNWWGQQLDTSTLIASSGNGLRLAAAGGSDQYRNYYNVNRQDVTQFVASFTYRSTPDTTANAARSGLVLVLFTSPFGSNGVTPSGGNIGEFGYTGGNATQNPLNPSVALILQNPDTSGRTSGAGFYTNHNVGGTVPDTGGVNVSSSHPISVTVRYNQPGDLANALYLTLVDMTTGAVYSPAPSFLNVPQLLGATTAHVGFTTHAGNNDQYINDFSFTTIPAPGCAVIMAISTMLAARRRR